MLAKVFSSATLDKKLLKSYKASRTIADLEEIKDIKPNYIAEALQYRPKNENTY